ncbi:MAG: family transporter protein, partial [Ilumatobacteraceae bacterium]|nr:family transporter protein [Ilumatobacteraceae bacterium]
HLGDGCSGDARTAATAATAPAARIGRPGRSGRGRSVVINLIRSEWIKFRSVRSTVVLVLAAGALVIIIAGFAANERKGDIDDGRCEKTVAAVDGSSSYTMVQPCDQVQGDAGWSPAKAHLGDITVGIPFALFLFGTLGVQIIGQEYRFNTIRPTFTAAPWRVRVLLAKLAVVTTATAAVALVMVLICGLIGAAMLSPFAIDGTDQRLVWGTVLFCAGWTMLGMGLGAIIRQPIAAMLVLLVEAFVVENIIVALSDRAARWMPFVNGIQMTVREPDRGGMFRSPLAGGIQFFVVATIVWVIGAALANRRDA